MTPDYEKLIHGTPAYDSYFVVNWCLFSICNFSCTYCPTVLHDGKARGPDIEVVKDFCRRVIEAKPDKRVFFEFTGGEVTYYKQFSELLRFIKSLGADVGLISNGSRTLEFWEAHKDLIDHICLSFHPEQGKSDHFFDVVKLLNEVTTVHVNIMMLPEKFEDLYLLARKISSEVEGISVAIQALFENMSGGIFNYTPKQQMILDQPALPFGTDLKYFRSPHVGKRIYRGEMAKVYRDGRSEIVQPPELIARGENNWVGWDCYIGLENIVVDFHGNVRRGWCGVGGVIGNVSDPELKIPSKPILCTSQNCFCALDLMATKVKTIP